jgi:hypothetical protein
MSFRNALYYWQHNKLTDTVKYADVIQFFDKNLALDSKIFERMTPLSALFPSLFDVIFETVPNEFQSEIKDIHYDGNLKIIFETHL